MHFFTQISKASKENSLQSDIKYFYLMIVRANEVDEMVRDLLPRFKEKCLDI